MRKRILSLTVVFAMILTFIPAFSLTASAAEFVGSGGNGTEDEPYLISNLDDLEAFRDYINADDDGGKDEYFKLTANIDMSDKYGSGGTSWTPIGTFSTGFNGEFDGAGHTVKVSLLYTDSTVNYIGLFGTVGSYISDGDGAIRNLGVSGSINSTAAVTAIGGIVGQNSGHGRIESCYSSVNINGKGSIGGIAGTNVLGSITNCYNTGNITNSSTRNDEGTGGIVGYNYEAIMSCYNTGKITLAEGGAASVGGIAGTHEQGIIENCYYLTGTAEKGISGTDDAVGTVDEKNTEEFKTLADDLNDGWGDAWKDSSFLGRPVFTAFPECGDGKEATPYTVPDKATLEKVRDYINDGGGRGEYFQQTADINLDGNDGNPWTPIGTGTNQFQGTFDGGGFTISGLYVNSGDYVGLFGQSYGTIKNLTVSGSVSGNGEVGGIVGENYGGVISDCRSDCAVSGSGNYVGGIAGYHTGTIKNCYNTGTVNGGTSGDNDYVGGIAGNNDGSIENCHNAGAITGTGNCTGGIVGENKNRGSIKNCYNTGTVNGVFDTGGIAGNNDGAVVENCYNAGTVSGSSTIGGIVGNTTGSIKNCYYLDSCGAAGEGTSKTADAFNSGEVTWLLQNGQGTQMWGQKLGDDSYPILTSDTDKKVCKVTFMTDDAEHAARYANFNGTVTLPENPSKANYTFERWSQSKDVDGEKFDASTSVTEDMTVYAVGRDHFGGDSADITRSETYGYDAPITVNLDNYMEYANRSVAAAGKFEYSIESDESSTSASIVSDNTLSVPTGLDAGDYTITVKATEKAPQYSLMSVDSYGTENVTLTVSVSIAKAASSVVSAPAARDLTYNGTAQELVTAGVAEGGEIQYAAEQEGEYSSTVPTGTNADTYTVWYKVKGDSNHNDSAPQSVDVTIKKANSTLAADGGEVTYGDTITMTATVTRDNTSGIRLAAADIDKVEFFLNETPLGSSSVTYSNSPLNDSGTATLTITADKTFAIGANTIRAEYGGSVNLNGSQNNEITVTMNKKTLTYTATATNRQYNGDTTVEVSLTSTNADGDNVTLTATGKIDDANAGNSKSVTITGVTVGGDDAEYYQAAFAPTEAVTVDIAKAESEITEAPTTKTDLMYTGEPLELVTAGTATGGELQYSTDGESYSPDVPTGTNADTYTVWYKVVGDGNHNDTEPQSVEVTIKKAASTATVTPQDLTYTGEAQELVMGEATGGELQYSTDGESYSSDIPKGTNADTYTIWYKVVGDENHNDSVPQSVDVTIKKAAPTVTVTANDLHYIGVAQELVTGSATGGTLQYSKSEDGDYSSDIPTETEVGTYTIWYKVVGDSNHTDLEPQSIQTEIKKAASVTDVDNAEVTYGDKLTLTATVSKKPFDGISLAALEDKVDFYLGETPLGSADVIYTDAELKDSGTATLEITADKRFAVGANTIRAEYGGSIDLAGSEKDSIVVTVNKKPLEYSVSAEGKVYDENTAIDVTLTPTNNGDDDVTLTAKGAVSSPNAGSYGKVNLTEITIGGDDAKYYSVDAEKSDVDLTSAIEIAKAEGTASVTMADYKCGDESVKPVPSSDTNGTESVTYSYAAKGTDNYSEGKPLTAGEYTVRAVFAATDNYAELTVTDDFTVSHEYSADWKNNENSHWHECVCGAKSDEAAHEAVIDAAIPATCTDTGKTEGSHCDVCGYVITAQTETDALGHSYGAWIITIDPTQTAAGKAKRVCALDSEHQETTDVPALIDGSWIKGERQEPTETEEGYQKYTSDEFGGFTEVLPALNAPPTYGVRGTTFDSDGNPKAGVHVVLKQGNTIFGSQDGVVSDEAGEFKFVGVGAGVYNIIAEFTEADETVTVTEMVVITDSDVDNVEVRLPTAKANSILIVEKDNDTPDVVVGGLDSVASDEASDIPDTSHVTVTMTIENQPADSENAEQREIDEICDNANINFIDIALVKQIDNGVAENIRETRKQLTIVIPFDTENKNNITVYRYHGGEATALAKTAEQGDCFTVGNGYVTIYTSKFSTYAIGYDESPSPSSYSGGSSSYMVRFETNGGSDVASQRISRNGVVKEPTAPTKDGYTFAGWYTDKALTTEYDFASKVTSSFTLYAKWNEDKTDNETETTPKPTDEPQPTAKSMPFTDVNTGDWFYNNVQYVYENGLMNGVSDTEFAPNETITRGMFVTILYRMEGEPSTGASTFADVPSDAYYANAVAWASANGIVKGYSDTEYAPDDAVTREQAAAILFRYAAYKGESPTGAWAIQLDYPDIAEISDWAAEGVMFCTMKDIMAGRDSGEFDPQSDITRAEGAAVFERYLNMAE